MSDHTAGRSRRRYLGSLAVAAAASAGAGCADLAGTADSTASDEATDTGDGTESADTTVATEPSETTATDAATASSTSTAGTPIHSGYETTEVRVTTPEGDLLGSVTAAIADTRDLRITGLSDTEYLPEDRGMLFVYDEPQPSLTYVMRRMDFPLDIVFADSEGVITSIHHVRAPDPGEDGNQIQASGRGQYVLEINRGWTAERGVEAGDVLQFEL